MVSNSKKKGQVTIFIILAILLVAVALSIFYFIPKIKTATGFDEKNPNLFLQSCMEDPLQETVRIIGLQGGSMEPENPVPYARDEENLETEILCYTPNYDEECTPLIPSPLDHVLVEIKKEMEPYAEDCFAQLVEEYESKGFKVNMDEGEFFVNFLSDRLVLIFSHELIAEKTDSLKFNSFRVVTESKFFNLLGHARNIMVTERYLGQVDLTLDYRAQDSDLNPSVEVYNGEGPLMDTRIYKLKSKSTGEEFNFGIRSMILSISGAY
jgi:hypothetical protein